jgi:cysteinyl-tRNA synthetase
MALKLYNTRTRKKEIFKPLKGNIVGIYSCGPTVYWYQHIGNLRTYIFSDILKRVLKHNNYKINHVVNITDVGHLTSDSDTGADKMEESARKEGKGTGEIADYYFSVFEKDLENLNIIEPNIWCKASEHIKEQIDMIKTLEKKGYTYRTSDGIYFDTLKFKDYGKFAKLNIEGLQAGKRVDLGEKKNKTDFALWKFSYPEDKRQQEWKSPWGKGFPGWHIECSAMSSKYLGEQFDIHTGGIDHINIHHTNEIAQSECAFGKKPSVNFWMHGAFLTFKDGKMSKSSGKILKISDLEEKGFEPLVYRYFCLTTHYRKQLIFSMNNLEAANNSYERLKNILSEIKDDGKENKKYLEEFEKTINDDLDMPNALQVLWKLVRDGKALGKIKTIKKMDEIFGLKLLDKEKIKIPTEIKKLIEEREIARKEKNWKKSDKMRDEIKRKGYEVIDGKNGWEVKKI